ncbi:MAG: hypothetical protein LBG93_09240 [Treponema sp.]|jgi:hypothetical protein|nr:hypothetical protein [Treponema sp.]
MNKFAVLFAAILLSGSLLLSCDTGNNPAVQPVIPGPPETPEEPSPFPAPTFVQGQGGTYLQHNSNGLGFEFASVSDAIGFRIWVIASGANDSEKEEVATLDYSETSVEFTHEQLADLIDGYVNEVGASAGFRFGVSSLFADDEESVVTWLTVVTPAIPGETENGDDNGNGEKPTEPGNGNGNGNGGYPTEPGNGNGDGGYPTNPGYNG